MRLETLTDKFSRRSLMGLLHSLERGEEGFEIFLEDIRERDSH